jgi:hypothetical protein
VAINALLLLGFVGITISTLSFLAKQATTVLAGRHQPIEQLEAAALELHGLGMKLG